MKNEMKILFATPCYGGLINSRTALNYIEVVKELDKRKIKHDIKFLVNSSLVTKGRNILTAHMLEDKSFTHLMFIDADMGFHTSTFFKLLDLDKHVVGCPYPAKLINWGKMYKNIDNIKSPNDLIKNSVNHVGYPLPIENLKNNKCEKTDFLGTGFMLIKREVFIEMMDNEPKKFYKPDYPTTAFRFKNKKHYAFFENGIVDGNYRGEDYHFCEKWRKMGGNIWIFHCKLGLSHIGSHEFVS